MEAYPLHWPDGWPREPAGCRRSHSQFKNNTFARARDSLGQELERLGARDIVLSTNIPLRFDGQPRGDFRDVLPDPGVAVYFVLSDRRPVAMARDEYARVSDNLRSLALAIEYLRGMRRHGGAQMMDRVFTGFAALPAPGAKRPCWAVLGIDRPEPGSMSEALNREMAADVVERAFRAKLKQHHPDVGGTDVQMAELNAAREQALREVGAA